MQIAIIGIGVSGSVALASIINHPNFNQDDHITLFEPFELGRGLPYCKDTATKMLNVEAHKMSVDPENPNDFVKWLESNKKEPYNFEEITPRIYYGDYLQDRFNDYYHHPQVTIIKQRVTDISIEKQLYVIKTDQWLNTKFDAVFCTIGHPMYNDFYKLKDNDSFIYNPYPLMEKLKRIKPHHKVGILGSGATGIDLFRFFRQDKIQEKPVTFLVRNTAFKLPDIRREDQEIQSSIDQEWMNHYPSFIPLSDIIEVIKEDLAKVDIDFMDTYHRLESQSFEIQKQVIETKDKELSYLEHYFVAMVPYFTELFNRLSTTDKQLVKETYDPLLNFFHSFTPLKTAKWILEELDKGTIKVLFDTEKMEANETQLVVNDTETFDYIINATGFNHDIFDNAKNNELIKNLLDRKIITPSTDNQGLLVKWPECHVVSPEYGHLPTLFFVGMFIKNTHYRTNDVRSVIPNTRKIVQQFMNNKKSTKE